MMVFTFKRRDGDKLHDKVERARRAWAAASGLSLEALTPSVVVDHALNDGLNRLLKSYARKPTKSQAVQQIGNSGVRARAYDDPEPVVDPSPEVPREP